MKLNNEQRADLLIEAMSDFRERVVIEMNDFELYATMICSFDVILEN